MTVPRKAKKEKKKQLKLKGIRAKVKPTPKQIRIAKNLASGMKKGEALIAAGVSPASARSNSSDIIAQPGVRAALVMACEEAGVTTAKIAQVLNEGLAATKIITANLLVTGEDGQIEMPCKNGFIDSTEEGMQKAFVRVEDFAVRHQYLRTASELLDLFPEKGVGGNPDNLPPGEEQNLIKQAEEAAGKRDISRYTVIRER